MTTDHAAAANLETFRETDGRFGPQPHAEAPLILEDDLLAKRATAQDYIKTHVDAVNEAAQSVYKSTMTLNALCLAADGINVGHIFFGGDKENWWVSDAKDAHGQPLDDHDIEIINETLHDSGVGFDVSYKEAGLDLGELAQWTPAAEPSAAGGGESVTSRATVRVEKALTAATPYGEPETRATDLLTDMRHWADKNGVDLDEIYGRSFEHYLEEV